jgi:hypothetical protein
MAVSSGDTITAAQFNNLQSRIALVLGTGSGDFGYGQPVASSQVTSLTDPSIPDGDSVLASQFNSLRQDLNTVFRHQNGQNLSIAPFEAGDIIGADESGTDLNYASNGSFTFVDQDTSKGFNDLLTVMTDLESNRFVLHPSQEEVQIRASDQRTTDWNGTISSQFTVSFSTANERRHFFNAGGEIRLEGTVDLSTSTGDSLARDEGWKDLLENPGEIKFDYNSTVNTTSAPGITFPSPIIGNDSLTSSFQEIFRKDANGGIYGNSYWKIDARQDSSTVIRFRVTLVDDGPESNPDQGAEGGIEPGITEPVTATVELEYAARRANGVAPDAVVTAFPAFSIVDTFE